MDTVKNRVARGVAQLDEYIPGWYNKIDLDRLDMGEPALCIAGQLGMREAVSYKHIGIDAYLYYDTVDYGFHEGEGLKEEWIRVINEKLALTNDD